MFITSFSVLCYEITFTRVFAYAQWHNLSSLIITMALLGFGASGTVIVLLQKKFETHYFTYLFISSLLFPIFLAAGFFISAFLKFNPYEIALNAEQIFNLFIYFILMGIPFFFGASVICMALMRNSVTSAYFFNLIGSGAGALAAMAALYFLHPYDIMILIISVSFIPALLVSMISGSKNFKTVIAAMIITISASLYISSFPEFKKVSEYKSISGALNLPDAEIIFEDYSPLSVVQVVEAAGLRSTAGLSIGSTHQVPVQKGIFFDGDSMSAITPFEGDLNRIKYIEHIASYLPFYLQKNNNDKVLIIGSGGGESILKSLLAGFSEIHVVEVNSNIISLMQNEFAGFSGNIYNSNNLTIFNSDGRSYIKQTTEKYDLIEISLLDAYNTAASGVYALNETYLYTTESFQDYYSHLSENGILSVTRWITTPPKDAFKLFNTVIESLKKMNIKNTGDHIAAIRSLQTVTLIVSKSPLNPVQKADLRKFCNERYYDLIYLPGIKSYEPNRYIKLQEPVFYNAFMKLLINNEKNTFINDYDFDINAPSDNSPYFYNFFKPRLLDYIQKYGAAQVPVTEWGYLTLLIILIPVVFISFFSIILPVLKNRDNSDKADLILFFALTALGFFFIEIPFIQKMALYLGHPSYSISVIISSVLIFSGTGSFFSKKIFPEKFRILIASLLIVFIILSYELILQNILDSTASLHVFTKIIIVTALIAPPAFFMGFPFPQGLVKMKKKEWSALPMAWGVNGFFSVISIITASLLAIIFGFKTVFIIAAICYIAAGLISLRFSRY